MAGFVRRAPRTIAPADSGVVRAAGLERDVMASVRMHGERRLSPRLRTWVSSVLAAACLLVGVLLTVPWSTAPWSTAPPRLLRTEAWDAVSPRRGAVGDLELLSYPQGLEARRQVERMLERDPEPQVWSGARDRARQPSRR